MWILFTGSIVLNYSKKSKSRQLNIDRTIRCLIQIRIAEEETKFGLPEEELEALLKTAEDLPNVQIVGLMGMATFTDNQDQITSEFNKLKDLYEQSKKCLSKHEYAFYGYER